MRIRQVIAIVITAVGVVTGISVASVQASPAPQVTHHVVADQNMVYHG